MTPTEERAFMKKKMQELAREGVDPAQLREKAMLALWLEQEVQELHEVLSQP